MSSNQAVPLFRGRTIQQGQKITGSLVRQTKREAEQVTASTEIAAVREEGHAFLASQALTNPAFRRKVLKHIDDPIGLGGFWEQYETKSPAQQVEEIGPVLNKLRQLILRPGLRAILGQSDPRFDLTDLFS